MNINTLLKGVGLLCLIFLPLVANDFYIELASKVLILGLFAMSLNLLVGQTGLVSFGHAAFFGVGSYSTILLSSALATNQAIWILLGVLLVTLLVAMLIGVFVLRTSGVYFIMATLAFSQMFYYLFHDTSIGGGSDGIFLLDTLALTTLLDLSNPYHLYAISLMVLIVCYLGLSYLMKTPIGMALKGIRGNEDRMRSLGYRTFYYKWFAFMAAGSLAGLAGFLHTLLYGFANPELLSWHQSGNVLLMVILGGIGSLMGAILGAFSFVFLQEVFMHFTEYWQLLMGACIVLTVLLVPDGIVSLPTRFRQFIQRLFNSSSRS